MRARSNQTRIRSGIRAKGKNTIDAGFARVRLQSLKLRILCRKDRSAARFETFEDLRLSVRNRFDRTEIFEMRGRDRGDDRNMRTRDLNQRANLAGMIHADL